MRNKDKGYKPNEKLGKNKEKDKKKKNKELTRKLKGQEIHFDFEDPKLQVAYIDMLGELYHVLNTSNSVYKGETINKREAAKYGFYNDLIKRYTPMSTRDLTHVKKVDRIKQLAEKMSNTISKAGSVKEAMQLMLSFVRLAEDEHNKSKEGQLQLNVVYYKTFK